ncbi:hypothetical protein RND71_043590 [Anisodus tanguticus]|uniref:Alpha/beta hydrolase n=1 Tax=Anisodus tanguticus TaxID=243964 RepID=A0AAE1QP26_9SOLA|nr:hypothetical protein RND71_043590 [Anisodus tanguticus]
MENLIKERNREQLEAKKAREEVLRRIKQDQEERKSQFKDFDSSSPKKVVISTPTQITSDKTRYGVSTGKPSEKNMYSDIECAWHTLRNKYGYSPEKIILYGQSIGTVPTVDLASKYEVAAVILHSPLMSGMRVAFPQTKRTWFFDPFPTDRNQEWFNEVTNPEKYKKYQKPYSNNELNIVDKIITEIEEKEVLENEDKIELSKNDVDKSNIEINFEKSNIDDNFEKSNVDDNFEKSNVDDNFEKSNLNNSCVKSLNESNCEKSLIDNGFEKDLNKKNFDKVLSQDLLKAVESSKLSLDVENMFEDGFSEDDYVDASSPRI